MPAISGETGRNIFAESEVGGPVNADVIVVVKENELAQTQMARKACRLLPDAFLQAAVADEHIGAVIDHIIAEGFADASLRDLISVAETPEAAIDRLDMALS